LGFNIGSRPDARPIFSIALTHGVVLDPWQGVRIQPAFAPINSQFDVGDTQSMSELIVHVTDDSFESDVLNSGEPVLIDYWAEWCGPCKMIAPVLDEIASEYSGRLKVAKLNIDDNPNTPPRYGIRGIPTLMLFKNGEVEATKVGAVSKSQLVAFIDSNL
jgi:thioredoxin 1